MSAPENAPEPPQPQPVPDETQASATLESAAPSPSPQQQSTDDQFDDYEPLTPELVEEEAIRGDFVIRWGVVLLAFLLGSTRIAETSTLVHVKTGQYLAAHGFLPPRHDVFSYTAGERIWTNLSWGFDLLAAAIYAVGSFAGLSVVKALVVAIAFWMIGQISRPGLPTWWGSICGAGALLAAHLRLAALPTLATLAGMALVLSMVYEWRQRHADSKRLWLLVPLFLVWCNLDSRAWLGLVFLVLYAAGDSLGALLKSPSGLSSEARKLLWLVTGACIAVTLLHPFGWRSLAAPWHVYGAEYPAIRDYIREAYLGSNNTPVGGSLIYFPMTTAAFWTNLNLAALSGLGVLLAAAATLFLNRPRLDWGEVTVYAGFLLLAVLTVFELPVAVLVGCVLATLNGQAWYAATFRQTYSVEMRELVFSRGGRAVTVLALAGIAFLGGTGRLRDVTAPRTGFGLDQNLETLLGDLERQLAGEASFDHRPFNFWLTQGDQLIWVGEKVFADSRAALYYSSNEDDNLLAEHIVTRDALHSRRDSDAKKSAVGTRSSIWQRTFRKHKITHAVVRLSSRSLRDYQSLLDLLQDVRHWEWTSLGAAAAVFYYLDGDDAELDTYVKSRTIDFRKRAWHEEHMADFARDRWIRPPSFYQKHFWANKSEPPPEVLEAYHLVQLAGYPGLPRHLDRSRTAMMYLAIRLAQAGLSKDPDAITGYIALGQAYDLLAQVEAAAARNGSRPARTGMRYLQAVASYNQALLGDPDNLTAHQQLATLYYEAGKRDLAMRHLEALDEVLSADPEGNAEDLLKLGEQIGQLKKGLEAIDDEVAQRAAAETNPYVLATAYAQRGCTLRALKELERGSSQTTGNPAAEQLRIYLLIEAGRVEEAHAAAELFAESAQQAGLTDWASIVAMASLPNADYNAAADRLLSAVEQTERSSLISLTLGLAFHPLQQGPWPLSTTQMAVDYLYRRPATVASMKMSAALVYLEEGQLSLAERLFREVLATDPDSSDRGLVAFYIGELTDGKEEIDLERFSERIPELFAPEPDEADDADNGKG